MSGECKLIDNGCITKILAFSGIERPRTRKSRSRRHCCHRRPHSQGHRRRQPSAIRSGDAGVAQPIDPAERVDVVIVNKTSRSPARRRQGDLDA